MFISTSNLSKVATVTESPESLTQDIMVVTDGVWAIDDKVYLSNTARY